MLTLSQVEVLLLRPTSTGIITVLGCNHSQMWNLQIELIYKMTYSYVLHTCYIKILALIGNAVNLMTWHTIFLVYKTSHHRIHHFFLGLSPGWPYPPGITCHTFAKGLVQLSEGISSSPMILYEVPTPMKDLRYNPASIT